MHRWVVVFLERDVRFYCILCIFYYRCSAFVFLFRYLTRSWTRLASRPSRRRQSIRANRTKWTVLAPIFFCSRRTNGTLRSRLSWPTQSEAMHDLHIPCAVFSCYWLGFGAKILKIQPTYTHLAILWKQLLTKAIFIINGLWCRNICLAVANGLIQLLMEILQGDRLLQLLMRLTCLGMKHWVNVNVSLVCSWNH